MCQEDLLFYINVFGWTHSPKDRPEFPDRLFVTWKFQDEGFIKIADALGDHDLCQAKSREMGATWMCLAAIEWRWHFKRGQTFLLVSRKAEYVDGTAKSLFWKIDYLHKHLPSWMLPTGRLKPNDPNRTNGHLLNPDNGSLMDGEATVADLAHGDRLTAIFLDEHARMKGATAISTGTRDATKCRLINSTYNGTGGLGAEFYRFSKNPDCEQLRMPWTVHPEKVVGLYTSKDGVLEILDKDYKFPANYQFILDGKTRSPWYDGECRRSNSQREIDQQVDMIPLGSGDLLFSGTTVEDHRKEFAIEPFYKGRLHVDPETLEGSFTSGGNGELHVWCGLDPRTFRPPPGSYSVGADISAGTAGDFSSYSALQILDILTGRQVARFKSNKVNPKEFAQFAVGLCKWFHGAKLAWEDNGPLGAGFRKEVVRIGYPKLYYRNVEGLIYSKRTKKPGWVMPSDGPGELLGEVQRSMRPRVVSDIKGKVEVLPPELIIQDGATLDEFLQYVWKEGKVVHDGSLATENESGKGKAHGDMAVALGVAWENMRGVQVEVDEPDEEAPAENTLAGILAEDERMRERDASRHNTGWGFNSDPVDHSRELEYSQ
jgi:hypothetical protein